jgi:hypothetical protein
VNFNVFVSFFILLCWLCNSTSLAQIHDDEEEETDENDFKDLHDSSGDQDYDESLFQGNNDVDEYDDQQMEQDEDPNMMTMFVQPPVSKKRRNATKKEAQPRGTSSQSTKKRKCWNCAGHRSFE